MTVVRVEWSSDHEIDPPAGESDEDFAERLREGSDTAWDHALDQVDSSTAELTDWCVV